MKFIKVSNPIVSISSKQVVFVNLSFANTATTHIDRIYRNKVRWKLKTDGIYVHRDIVENYKLNL